MQALLLQLLKAREACTGATCCCASLTAAWSSARADRCCSSSTTTTSSSSSSSGRSASNSSGWQLQSCLQPQHPGKLCEHCRSVHRQAAAAGQQLCSTSQVALCCGELPPARGCCGCCQECRKVHAGGWQVDADEARVHL
jgi:hypothetical protein